jgi:hypothetical protein
VATLVDRIASAAAPFVWLDDTAYVARLLAGGRIPWLDAAEVVALRRKASSLLRTSVTVLPVGAVVDACLGADAGLRDSMATKKRAIGPLRVLLADAAVRAKLFEVTRALRSSFPAVPFVLAVPSPRAWVMDAYRHAFGEAASVEVAAEETDSGAVYVAEFLRAFGELDISGLLLEEHGGAEPRSAAEIAWYKPVINVAAHYRWDLGLQLTDAAGFTGPLENVAFAIAPQPLPGAIIGVTTPQAFWTGSTLTPVPTGGFRFAQIPADGVPEQVLDRLAILRNS